MFRTILSWFTAFALTAGLSAGTAVAGDIYAFGTTSPGSFNYTIAAAITGTCNKGGDMLRVQTYGTYEQILPLVSSGEITFAAMNVLDIDAATKGAAGYAAPLEHLQALAHLFTSSAGFMVRADSGIESLADIKGKRLSEYTTQPNMKLFTRAILATAGLADSDVEFVSVGNFSKVYDEFADGRFDVALVPVGQPALADLRQRIGELRFLPIDDSPAAIAAMQGVSPLVYITEIEPNPNLVGVDRPLKMLSYDTLLLANDQVPSVAVEKTIMCLHDNRDALVAASPRFKAFRPETMAKPGPLAYHPAAEAYYRANGLWPTQ